MATIASHPILCEPRSARGAASALQAQPGRVKGERTTGLFQAPVGVGNPVTVTVFLSNPASYPESAEVRVRRLTSGRLLTVFYRVLTVPPGEARTIDLSDLAGQTIEVSVSPPHTALLTSVSVTEYFLADGGTIVRLAKYPGDFVYV